MTRVHCGRQSAGLRVASSCPAKRAPALQAVFVRLFAWSPAFRRSSSCGALLSGSQGPLRRRTATLAMHSVATLRGPRASTGRSSGVSSAPGSRPQARRPACRGGGRQASRSSPRDRRLHCVLCVPSRAPPTDGTNRTHWMAGGPQFRFSRQAPEGAERRVGGETPARRPLRWCAEVGRCGVEWAQRQISKAAHWPHGCRPGQIGAEGILGRAGPRSPLLGHLRAPP